MFFYRISFSIDTLFFSPAKNSIDYFNGRTAFVSHHLHIAFDGFKVAKYFAEVSS